MKLAPPREYSAAQRYPAPKGGRQSHICPFRRGSPGSLPLWHVMPWSLHFVFRGGPEKVAKKRGRRPGEKSLSPGRRSAQPVIPCQRISGLNVNAAFHRNNTGCGTRPGVRSPAGASCDVTGIFLMAGVTKPLTLREASKVRRLKNKKAAHTIRPAPTPGPLTLAFAFSIHFDNRIKRITHLHTFFAYSPVRGTAIKNSRNGKWSCCFLLASAKVPQSARPMARAFSAACVPAASPGADTPPQKTHPARRACSKQSTQPCTAVFGFSAASSESSAAEERK